MRRRATAILACLGLALATPGARAQLDVTPTTMPAAASSDARPFPGVGGGGGASTTQPTLPNAPAATSLGLDLGRMFSALVIVLALIGLAYWAARRLTGRHAGATATRAVKVLSRTPLAPRQQVVLLQVGRRVIVVAESAGQLSPLAQIDDADEVAQLLGQIGAEHERKASSSFGGTFRRSQASFDEPAPTSDEPPTRHHESEADDLDRQRSELSGLLDKVRALRGQIDK